MFVIEAGQSNAVTFNNTGPAPYVVNDLTYIWNDTQHWWEVMRPGVNTGTPNNPTTWGPEVGFANAFRAEHPTEVLAFVKSAMGSTGIAPLPNAEDWSPASHGEMFDKTTAMVARAMAQFGGPQATHPTVLFVGGETDATYEAGMLGFRDNLLTLVAGMKSQWGADHIEVAAVHDVPELPYNEGVRWGAFNVAATDDHVEAYQTSGGAFTLLPDHVHFDAQGALEVGKAGYGATDTWY